MRVFYRNTAIVAACAASVAAALACADERHPTDSAQLHQMDMGAGRDGGDAHTMGSGTTSKLLGRARFDDDKPNFKVKRETADWQIEIKAKPSFDMAVQSITFEVGGQSGWHRHPGPVLIQVTKGEMTFYRADDPACTPIRKHAGEAYLDVGENPHIARNEGTVAAENVVVYFAPPGMDLKIDAPRPGNCAF